METLFKQIFRPLAADSELAQHAHRDFAERGNSWPYSLCLDDGIQRKLWLVYFESSVHAVLLPTVNCETGPFAEVDLPVLFAHTAEIWDAQTEAQLVIQKRSPELPKSTPWGSREGNLWWVSEYLKSLACLDAATDAQGLKHVTWDALQPVAQLLTVFQNTHRLVAHNRAKQEAGM